MRPKRSVVGGNEPFICVDDGDECANLAEENAVDDKEVFLFADDSVSHDVEDGR